MRLAVSELQGFYETPMGALVGTVLSEKLRQAWEDTSGLRLAGFGFVTPFLATFDEAERRVALSPAATGVKAGGAVPSTLVDDHAWPLPDASIDRLMIVHGLEEVVDPRRLFREAWRVLADDGRLIIAVANRRGPWSIVETSPFAAGRPYSRRQLDLALTAAMFSPVAHATALHFPPLANRLLLRLAPTWERLGASIADLRLPPVFPNLAGVNLVEVQKTTALPIGGNRAEVFRPGLLKGGALGHAAPARTSRRDEADGKKRR